MTPDKLLAISALVTLAVGAWIFYCGVRADREAGASVGFGILAGTISTIVLYVLARVFLSV
jgi:hypothetical protein